MRLWSVHPRYLDTAGLTACWREALLAQKVLTGVTRGYRHHPQLERFRAGSALALQLAPHPRNRRDVSVQRADPDETSAAAAEAGVAAAEAGVAAVDAGSAAAEAGVAAVDAGSAAAEAGAAAGVTASGATASGGWPGDLVVAYLHGIADEADARGFAYDRSRIAGPRPLVDPVEVTDGQLALEWSHLLAKLAGRSPVVSARWVGVVHPDPHPCFVVVPGPVAPWEVVGRT